MHVKMLMIETFIWKSSRISTSVQLQTTKEEMERNEKGREACMMERWWSECRGRLQKPKMKKHVRVKGGEMEGEG